MPPSPFYLQLISSFILLVSLFAVGATLSNMSVALLPRGQRHLLDRRGILFAGIPQLLSSEC